MKVYILVGIKENEWEENFGDIFCYETRHNHSLHSEKSSALSEYNLEKVLGKWEYDDYDIEEHEL